MHFTLCGKRWIKGERFLGGFISVLVFLLRRGNHQFSPPVLGASSGSTHGKQKEYCHYISLLSAAYSNTDLGECLWWGVLSQVEDWTHGDRTPKPSSIPLLHAGIDSLPHLAVPCRSEVSSLARCVVKAGFQLRPCCWPAKDHLVLSPASCPWPTALGLAFWESLGSCNPSTSWFKKRKEHFSVVKQVLVRCQECFTFSAVPSSWYL